MSKQAAQLSFIAQWINNHKTASSDSASTLLAANGNIEPLAITGLAGYFPQCMNITELWRHLDADDTLITSLPAQREAWYRQDEAERETPWSVLAGGFIPDIASFDAAKFGILPLEAEEMDPRQRLLLMSTQHTLEDAGLVPASLSKSQTGVFIGCESNEYAALMARHGYRPEFGLTQADSMIANRISYQFDLAGPSELINATCAGFAVALHRATLALRAGIIDRAIVGAANIMLVPDVTNRLNDAGQLTHRGQVLSFGENGDGFIRSEGVGTLLLERLADVEKAGRRVYAVVKHTRVNFNGQGGVSMASPNTDAHCELIKDCYREAAIDPRRVSYIEAQGMGLPVADIAEWTAFNRALSQLCDEQGLAFEPGYCRVSSLKPLLGHMHSASSLGALFKVIRSLQTDKIHKIPGFERPNDYCDTQDTPCVFAKETQAWPAGEHPRIAAIHSYGSGGNNAHILIEEYRGAHPAGTEFPAASPHYAFAREYCWFQLGVRPTQAAHAPDARHLAEAEADVRATIARLLGMNGVDDETCRQAFTDLGLDSVSVDAFVSRLVAAYPVKLRRSDLFSYTTPAALARVVAERMKSGTAAKALRQTAAAPRSAQSGNRDIAIIGIDIKVAGADNAAEFWQVLREGRSSIGPVPQWRRQREDLQMKTSRGGFMAHIDCFDPLFFKISPREAHHMDPHHRLLLQSAWRAIEDAGYDPQTWCGQQHGIFVGMEESDYPLTEHSAITSVHTGTAPARIGYFLDTKGPLLAIGTACSSSLVALHYACQSILNGESELALAGGCNLICQPERLLHGLSRMGDMLSPDGACYAFDHRANGMVVGEGCATVVLKRHEDALRDGDDVYAIIKGSAINYDGKTNGLTAPSGARQSELYAQVYQQSGVSPDQIDYVVSHGTGTLLGDPVECNALIDAFQSEGAQKKQYCALTSPKTNIGHTQAAAGIVNVITAALALKQREIPPSLNYTQPNADIDFADSPFYVNTELKRWDRERRFAAVSSFGHTGTNAHLVLQNAETPMKRQGEQSGRHEPYLIVLSAKSEAQLKQMAANLLAADEPHSMGDLAYTLQVGRTPMPHRLALFSDGWHSLQEALGQYLASGAEISASLDLYYADVSGTTRSAAAQALLRDEGGAHGLQPGQTPPLARLQLAAWLLGETVDWAALYHDAVPRRMHLPTYPFAEERYWFASTDELNALAPRRTAEAEQNDAVWIARERWREQPLPDAVNLAAEHYNRRVICVLPAAVQTTLGAGIMQIAGEDSPALFLHMAETDACSRFFAQLKMTAQTASEPESANALLCVVEPESAMDQLVPLFQGVLSSGLAVGRILIVSAFTDALERCYADALVAFGASLRLVLPETSISFAGFDTAPGAERWQGVAASLPAVWAELQSEPGQNALYLQGKRHVLAYEPVQMASGAHAVNNDENVKAESCLKMGGCYLITGGLGGLGMIFARYLCENFMAKVILIGRSPLNLDKQTDLRAIKQHGGQITYFQADVSELSQMESLFADCRRQGIRIDGILHAAGAQTQQTLAEKDLAGVHQVLAPKVQGVQTIDNAWQSVFGAEHALDFIVYFSSSAAIFGDFGAGDYAVANRFQMAYANSRHRGARSARKTVAIGWPVWADGGMTQGSAEREQATSFYLKTSGQRALCSEEGLRVFEQLLAGEEGAVLVMAGQHDALQRLLAGGPRQQGAQNRPAASIVSHPEMKGLTVEQCVLWELQQTVSDILSIERHRLQHDVNLADFGFDSISLAEFAAALSRRWKIAVSPALFFGHATLSRLSQYFMATHGALMHTCYGSSPGERESADPRAHLVPPSVRNPGMHTPAPAPSAQEEPIAVIGMSGRFPGARDVEEMWRYLAEGKSSVSQVSEAYLRGRDESCREHSSASARQLWCGVMPDVAEFDPLFFEISPREAQNMDPAQRQLLQETWKALEHAGYGDHSLRQHSIGTFVGVEEGTYGRFTASEQVEITANHNGILASRLAYFLDLHGPVLAINTACSSGLVAAHLACASLRNRECDTALAAGVSLQLSTEGFDIMARSGMLSEDGTCYTFDQRANGMVPGEAVVVLVLKRLSQAEADGDRIHGLIRASGINYDGKTNGITAPNGVAQADLLKSVYQRAGISPEQIEYIVTHGTGTRLGDPVEINALNEAFKAHTDKQAFCALTSTKTNFGHTFAASGLLSAVSLIEALQRQIIPASLNCQQENDYITWAESPFYVNKTARAWPRVADKRRMGAVSAFGMSGTNAHLLIEEYAQAPAAPEQQRSHYLLCLSAKTEEALYLKAGDLMLHLQRSETESQSLAAISYTLLHGRSHFRYRLAIVVEDREGAIVSLQQAEHVQRPNLFRGNGIPLGFIGQPAIQKHVDALLRQSQRSAGQEYQENLCALADYYCQGYVLKGDELLPDVSRCVVLPAYPFARERCWVEGGASSPARSAAAVRGALHPMLQENASTLGELRFRAEFSGEEFFLKDHRIYGQKVLPGVCYLEMARAAYACAASPSVATPQPLRFSMKQVLWLQPAIAAQQTMTLYLGLCEQNEGLVDYRVYSENEGQQRTIHSQGVIVPHLNDAIPAHRSLDVEQLKSQMTGPGYLPAQCYQRFRNMGLEYGESFQCIEQLLTGERQVLAKIALPNAATLQGLGLHPSLIDAALQTSLGLHGSEPRPDAAYVPFALEQLEVFGNIDTRLWVWLRLVTTDNAADPQVQKMDVDLCDERGRICVSLRGFSTRILSVSHPSEQDAMPETEPAVEMAVSSQRKTLSGTEYFLQDHGGLLPGMLSLAWMSELAAAHLQPEDPPAVIGLKQVVWRQPVAVGARGADIDLHLSRDQRGYRCTVSSQGAMHAQARVMTGSAGEQALQPLPLGEIAQRCRQRREQSACAEFFAAAIGPRLLGITRYDQGHQEALIALETPGDVDGETVALHPTLMNGAVLAAIMLATGGERQSDRPLMPFSLDELRVHRPLPGSLLAYIRQHPSGSGSQQQIVSCDIWFTDRHGHILVEMKGLKMIAAPAVSLVFARPQWARQQIAVLPQSERTSGAPPRFILAQESDAWQTALQSAWPACRIMRLSPDADQTPAQLTLCLQQLFAQIKESTLACTEQAQRQTLFILAAEPVNESWLSAAAGLLKTARQEQPGLNGKVIRYPNAADAAMQLPTQLHAEMQETEGAVEIRYDAAGGRSVREWHQTALTDAAGVPPMAAGSVIWITGGLGGIGYQLVRELGARYQARFVLSGRSALQGLNEQRLAALRQQGAQVAYYQGDVTDPEQVRRLVRQILQDEGRLNGVIHSAGVTRDAFIVNKTEREVLEVLGPKVAGTLALDEATRDCDLDFMVLFSSLSSAFGNSGQADYACANGFMDGFAFKRNQQVADGLRRGKTLSLNWPLWRDGGMGISEQAAEQLRRQSGLVPMPAAAGIEALLLGLHSPEPQLAVMYGEAEQIGRRLSETRDPLPAGSSSREEVPRQLAGENSPVRVARVHAMLVSMVAQLQKLDENKVELDMELSKYGFNSIDFTEFAGRLNKAYGLTLMPTVFFEHSTLRAMGHHLADTYPDAVAQIAGTPEMAAAKEPPPIITATSLAMRDDGEKTFGWRAAAYASTPQQESPVVASTATTGPQEPEAIAVIGMSGRFPQSRNLDEFWRKLEANQDLISTVPADRWNWREYYGNPHETPGKTNVNCGGFMQDVDCFDPLFFGISPREAQSLDPQFRIFLETVWATIEDAGYRASDLSGSNTGVFVGVSTSEYKDAWLKYSHDKFGIGDPPWLSHFALANRVSYILNLHGPSEPIDTACSSSLVAIHRAIEAMRAGSCDMALVGGVNIIVNPGITITAGEAGILSEDGRCKTFDISADGYGRGEGVGAIMLKPLRQAIADGDRIHGLIRGSAENHGGKATSPTAPNPVAQQALLTQAYRRSSIDPARVGYIETHGTGTRLGDPIEIDGLRKAFTALYQERGQSMPSEACCGLGSVKTNIGHLEAAAGISGVLKVLLMFRHQKIPGNVHLQTANPYLDLAESPFYLVRETQPWPAMQDAGGRPLPRIAGVSSFGIGGANAHIVLEEYVAEPAVSVTASSAAPVAIVLSAKKAARLEAVVQGLATYLDSAAFAEQQPSLADIAYTLQVGREAMDERLAFVADSVPALQDTLSRYLADPKPAPGIYRGNAKAGNGALFAAADEDRQGEYGKRLEAWVQGAVVDWKTLYSAATPPRKIGLPTYPFARDRFWLKEKTAAASENGEATPPVMPSQPYRLHPLVHRNTSDLSALSFTSWFDGGEFFLSDHVVMGKRLLPGVAYLEMARAAVEQLVGRERRLQLTQIVWIRPYIAAGENGLSPVMVKLLPQSPTVIRFEICSQMADGQTQTHCQGKAIVADSFAASETRLDLSVAMAEHQEGTLEKAECYRAFHQLGIEYGTGHQGIERLHVAKGRVLAQLVLPETLKETLGEYVLHPSLMDSALQATLGLSQDHRLGLPFELESMEILHRCTSRMWARIAYEHGSEPALRAKVQKLTVELYDDTGRLCVHLQGFSVRAPEPDTPPGNGTLLLVPTWSRKQVRGDVVAPHAYSHRQTLFCGEPSVAKAMGLTNDLIFPAMDSEEHIALDFQQQALALFGRVKSLLDGRPKQPMLLQVAVVGALPAPFSAALCGVLKTARLENGRFIGQLIELEATARADEINDRLRESSLVPEDIHIRYGGEGRQVLSWREVHSLTGTSAVSPASGAVRIPWKERGVYLITGGAGGLGLIFATEIARQTRGSRLILTGRTSMNDRIQAAVSQLIALGAQVDYCQLDVCDRPGVEALTASTMAKYGAINGVLHCAGVLRDSYILKKSPEDFLAVLAPKVQGTVNLDLALAQHPLDFFILFSSTAAALGNPGQADYVTANSFMDAYAHYRQRQVAAQARMGRSLTINWPLWKEGGMAVDDASETLMYQNTGMIAMSAAAGLQAFYQALEREENQVLVIAGDIEKLRLTLANGGEQHRVEPAAGSGQKAAVPIDKTGLEEAVQQLLIREVSALLDVAATEIDLDLELTELGFDSILTTGFANTLNQRYQLDLLPTLFFEYPTIAALSGYLTVTYQAAFAARFTAFAQPETGEQQAAELAAPAPRIAEDASTHAVDIPALHEAVQSLLMQEISALLHVDAADIDNDIELSELGFDSILTTSFANKLNRQYALELLPTVFFEYPTVAGLTHYLAERYRARFSLLFAAQVMAQAPQSDEAPAHDVSAERSPQPKPSASPAVHDRNDAQEAIAIVGMSGSFPMAPDLDAYWENLLQGKDCISEVPPDRWNWRDSLQAVHSTENRDSIRWGGFIQDMAEFDPLFFGISPREAELMDPQQRLLMTHAWKVIEDAGYSAASLAGSRLGIYVGTGNTGYAGLIVDAKLPAEGFTATGIVPSVGPNRMSYFLNVHGPSEPIETACSSSLIAIHRGVSALRHEGCDMVIVGGINTLVTPDTFVSFCKAGMLAADGRCKTFSSQADGYVRGEGAGMLLLKRLSAAEADGDHIYGVIRGSAQNHGGRASSLTAPNPKAQAALLVSAYRDAGIDPRTVGYIEAHGTGTKLGDPIEINSLKAAFHDMQALYPGEKYPEAECAVGSVKTNIGHLEMAAGIAGVIKVLLQLKHQTLVKSLHCEELNPYIDFTNTPFYVVQENRPWRALRNAQGNALPRRAGVSSFGFGGANAHIVIEEYRGNRSVLPAPQSRYVIPLSARDDVRLRDVAQNLRRYLDQQREKPELTLMNLAYTLQVGRDAMTARLGWIVQSLDELRAKLDGFLQGNEEPGEVYRGQRSSHNALVAQFSADEELREAIAKWVVRGKYARLLSLWCQGLEFDWSGLYQGQQPLRLSLPTYPFDRQAFWLPTAQGQEHAAPHVLAHDVHRQPEKIGGIPSPSLADSVPQKAEARFDLEVYLTALIGRQLKVAEAAIGPDTALEELGMDSVVSIALLNDIREKFPQVSRSLFMEYHTVGEIQLYLRSHFSEQLAMLSNPGPLAEAEPKPKESKMRTQEEQGQNISIIGMAGIFPQAEDIAAFWDNLRAGRAAHSTLSDKRRRLMALDEEEIGSSRIGAYLDGVEYFDRKLFKVSHKDAQKLDPQIRKLLEVIWQSITDAGYTLSQFREKRTGLFVATRGHSGYQDIQAKVDPQQAAQWRFQAEQISAYANRISNILNLSGLSEIVETGCASFLVAIRHAMSAIREGRCQQAIVATAELGLSPFAQNRTDDQALYSSHPVTKSFASDSDGYVKSEVVGAIILKAEDDALAQGDAIYVNVKGVGVSHGGKAPLKWYSPNIEGQKAAIVAAFAETGLDPATISYIEPEANGSQLGDAAELVAIQSVYGPHLQASQASNAPSTQAAPIAIGSLKPLTGHAETASTFPVLVKMVLSMHHRQLAKIAGLGALNEGITLTDGFELLDEDRPWQKRGPYPRRGAIHSMSIGGVNAHLLLEDYETEHHAEWFPAERPLIFLFSEADEAGLNLLVSDYLDFLPRALANLSARDAAQDPTPEKQQERELLYLERLEYTLQQGREHRDVRLAVSAASIAQLQEKLQCWLSHTGHQDGIYDSREAPPMREKALSSLSDGVRQALLKWLAGDAVEWAKLRQDEGWRDGLRKLHLPANPLRKLFCWHEGFHDSDVADGHHAGPTNAEQRSVVE
ncbi:polyketide synthase [Serratia plymuthica]|uniref:Polyketide synthase n=2 Tax=Serratia plymuthica TaxID=82996 RepID=A0A318P4P3_SERPL|nr:SDR family NAD(P)-dependent oxidoreductase [Serratia plymuthica]PYD40058.1 polyketide synthase [Serratia plymuthica]